MARPQPIICFPAKLAHGHIFDLAGKDIDRLFYPTVVYEEEEYADALNSYNCPVVTGYPDLLKSAVNPEKKFKIPLDNPSVSFKDFGLLKDQLYLFFRRFGINYRTISEGVEKGVKAQASKSFTRIIDELGFNNGITDRKQKVTFHTLRHTYATHLYESTHDLYLTQRSLGHATGTMTARYAKMSESRLREGAAALQAAFTNGAKKAGQVVNFKK